MLVGLSPWNPIQPKIFYFPGTSEHFRYISSFPSNSGRTNLIYDRGQNAKNFSIQSNETDILKDALIQDENVRLNFLNFYSKFNIFSKKQKKQEY